MLRLRPPDVEELGLAASLRSLVAGWNACAGERTLFSIELAGDVDALPLAFAANLYRIAQEAANVELRLHVRPAEAGDDGCVELCVDDDGGAGAEVALKAGMGLLGMRERVAALGGALSVEAARPNGLRLRARIPFPASAPNERMAA